MKKIAILLLFLLFVANAWATVTVYYIQVSHNDEFFIINGEKFSAKTYCFNMEKGDPVIFIKGSPFGACVSAEIFNLRTERSCRLWCE